MVHGLTVTNSPCVAENYIDVPKMTDLSSQIDNPNPYGIKHSVKVPLGKLMKLQTCCYDYGQFQKPREGAENGVILNVTSVDRSSDTSSNSSKSESDDNDVEILEDISSESHAISLKSQLSPKVVTCGNGTFHDSNGSLVSEVYSQSRTQNKTIPSNLKGRPGAGESSQFIKSCIFFSVQEK
jgi:hypothetical protein